MNAARTALLAGASGLVGGECLKRLLVTPEYGRIVVVTRRPLGPQVRHARVRQVVCGFDRLESVAPELAADDVFCALGTTIAKAGSKAAFRTVDLDYPRSLAAIARSQGAKHFSLVSALGARRGSPFFYSRVKGELEQALRAMDWPSLCFVRPSVIAGDRREPRPLERLAEHALRFAPRPWRPVPARDIAAVMVATALRSPLGTTVIESGAIPPAG